MPGRSPASPNPEQLAPGLPWHALWGLQSGLAKLYVPRHSFAALFLISLHALDFEVTDPLPGVNWTLSRNFAGNIPVNRPDHPNNTLFFWAWEKENGSLTAAADERAGIPWGIWLNGG